MPRPSPNSSPLGLALDNQQHEAKLLSPAAVQKYCLKRGAIVISPGFLGDMGAQAAGDMMCQQAQPWMAAPPGIKQVVGSGVNGCNGRPHLAPRCLRLLTLDSGAAHLLEKMSGSHPFFGWAPNNLWPGLIPGVTGWWKHEAHTS